MLFVTIVRDCQPSKPRDLWDELKRDLCDDLRHFLCRQRLNNLSDDTVFDYRLHLIETRLCIDDKTMENIGLSKPCFDWDSMLGSTHLNRAFVLDGDQQTHLLQQTLPRLNADQRAVFDAHNDQP
jgi:hypothetical protein